MKAELEIDKTLRLLGSVASPSGLETRIGARLRTAEIRRFPVLQSVSIMAVAASVGVAAVALVPGLRDLALHELHRTPAAPASLAVPHPTPGFGAASAVHVPTAPVEVQPVPVTQGRGHSRSGRAVLPNATRTPLPHGVAVPPHAHIPVSGAGSQTQLAPQQ